MAQAHLAHCLLLAITQADTIGKIRRTNFSYAPRNLKFKNIMQLLQKPYFSVLFLMDKFKLIKYKAAIYLSSTLFVLAMLYSCGTGDRDGDGIPDAKDKCPDVYVKTKDGCPEKEKKIGNIYFYMDNSASMDGYFNKAKETEFRTIITDLTAKIDKNIKPIGIWFITDTISGPFTMQQFSSAMATKRIANKDGYQLHDMIYKIIALKDSNDITILVSDYILSYPDAEIKKNPEINKTNAPTDLKSKVYSTFFDLKKQDISTSIYAFKSKFYGNYYDYRNRKTKLDGSVRPFYVWVMGDRELLLKFNSKLTEIPTFLPEKSLHCGFLEEPITKYNIIPQIERRNCAQDGKNVKDVKLKDNELTKFAIGMNLDKLPDYAKEIKYLQENILLTATGCEANIEVKAKSAVNVTKLKSEPQKKLFENATHILVFKINSMSLSEAKIEVTLPLLYDTWYMDWSCKDDKDASLWDTEYESECRGKTFSLEYLISGVTEAYDTKNKNFIEFSITLNK